MFTIARLRIPNAKTSGYIRGRISFRQHRRRSVHGFNAIHVERAVAMTGVESQHCAAETGQSGQTSFLRKTASCEVPHCRACYVARRRRADTRITVDRFATLIRSFARVK